MGPHHKRDHMKEPSLVVLEEEEVRSDEQTALVSEDAHLAVPQHQQTRHYLEDPHHGPYVDQHQT